MASAHSFDNSSQDSKIMWEHGDAFTDIEPPSSHSEIDSPLCSPPMSPTSSQPLTPGLTTPMVTMSISSQSSSFFPDSRSTPVSKSRGRPKGRSMQKKFHGNQFTTSCPQLSASQSTTESTTRKRKHPAFTLSTWLLFSIY